MLSKLHCYSNLRDLGGGRNLSTLTLATATSIVISSCLSPLAASGSEPHNVGVLELEEYRKTQPIEVNASQSKLFLIKNRIVRTSVADPGIAEPVVLGENILVLLGKNRGETTLQVWDDLGGEVHLNVIVHHNSGPLHSLFLETPTTLFDFLRRQRMKRSKAFVSNPKLELKECADPRESKDKTYLEQIATELATLSKVSVSPTISTTDQKLQQAQNISVKSLQTRSKGLPRTDELTVSGGQTVVIASGYKTKEATRTIDLCTSQSRTFRTRQNLAKLTTSDPAIAEPIAISNNEFVLLGKAPGKTTFEVEGASGNALAVTLKVNKPHNKLISSILAISGIFAKKSDNNDRAPLPPVIVDEIELCEQIPTETITLKPYQPKFFNTSDSLVRTSIADPGHVDQVLLSATQTALVGKNPGRTTAFLWDNAGNLGAINLLVTGDQPPKQSGLQSGSKAQPSPISNTNDSSILSQTSSKSSCEIWTGSRKDVVSVTSFNHQGFSAKTSDSANRDTLIALNNEAVLALEVFDYAKAIELLEKALTLDPTYKSARENLAITYNNFGLSLQKKPAEAICYFHHAVFLDATNLTTQENLAGIIRKLGKDPNSFSDRLDLGDEALRTQDTKGAIVEYEAALQLREDSAARDSLAKARRIFSYLAPKW
jgi:Flp pilus assembly secretin CpaC